jgi:hypothetical protein
MEPDPDPGGPKTCGSVGSGFGSATLLLSVLWIGIVLMPIQIRLSNFDADPDPFPSFTFVGKSGEKIDFQQCQFTFCFIILVSIKGVKIFSILGSIQ